MVQSSSFGSRDERIAFNEAYCRDLNERKAEWMKDGRPAAGFRCECGHAECSERIPLSRTEWKEARADPRRFAVVPTHVAVGVEDVTKEYPHVWFVEKRGVAGEITEKLD